MTVRCVALQSFTAEALPLADEETLREFQAELAANPEAGDLMRNFGGLRKTRLRLPKRGKNAGANVVYLWLPEVRRVILLMLYTRAVKPDLSLAQLARVRAAIAPLRWRFQG